MKKIILSLALVASLCFSMNAQDISKAIGIRGGNYNWELSYQNPLGNSNRLELDLGLYSGYGLNIAGVYQWTKSLSFVADGLHWYYGFGPEVGLWSKSLALGICGQIGLEYNFNNIPLQLSLDYRPGWYFIPSSYHWNTGDGAAFSVRYKF